MWQSRVENEHYSGLAKIELNAVFVAVGLCLRESRSTPLKRVHAMSYRPPNTALLRVAVNLFLQRQQKTDKKDRDEERLASLEAYLMLVLVFFE